MKKKRTVFLQSTRLYLRPLCLRDVSTLQAYANDPEVRHYVANVYPISLQDEEAWIKKVMERNPNDIILAVVLKKNDKMLGCMGLHHIDYVNRIATTGTLFGAKEEWNKGYAQESKMLLLEYAFLTLNLRKVCSTATAPNIGSIKHNKKCGYIVEGVQKDQWYRDGKYHDNVLLAVFKEDWLKIYKKV